jgi:hypothetical protein
MDEKQKNIRSETNSWNKASTIIAALLVCGVVALFVVSFYQRMDSQGAYRREYQGRVVDKWVTYHETELGTQVSRHLRLKSKNGEAFQVTVSAELYDEAKVDLWVIKNKDGFKILATKP